MPSKSAIKKQRQRERQRQQHLQQKRHQKQDIHEGGRKRKKEVTSQQRASSSAISLASSSYAEGDSDATTESPLMDESVALVSSGSICVSEAFLGTTLVNRLRDDARALYDFGAFTAAGLKHEEAFSGGRAGIGRARRNSRDESAAISDFRDVRVCSSCGLFDDAKAASEHARILRGADTAANERKKKMPKIPTDGISSLVDPKFDEEAREELFARMADLREQLQRVLGRRLSPFMELQYLRYPGGGRGFYGRHVDQQVDEAAKERKIDKTDEEEEVEVEGVPRASKGKKMTTTKNKKKRKHGKNRSVSILIYLNNNAWDVKRDGGALRAYLPPAVVSDNYQPPALGLLGTARDGPSESKVRVVEIAPKGGTVVLFDSRTLEHEAMPTLRTRWALVGWFMDGGE